MKKITLLLLGLCAIALLHAQVSKTVNNVTAGGLKAALTSTELTTVTNLTVTGTIDATDFVTMRDNMPALSVIDISGVTIDTYTGIAGTAGATSTTYPANAIPIFAFYNNDTGAIDYTLTSILLPTAITSIGSYAFEYCNHLTSIAISPLITAIGENVFLGASCAINVDANNPNYSSADGVLFNKYKTTLIQAPLSITGKYTVPASVTYILDYAFAANDNLTSVDILSTTLSIGNFAFVACHYLTSVNLTNAVTDIGQSAFARCTSLKSIHMPSSITSIPLYCFYADINLTSITIPSSVTSIGEAAFDGCEALTSITALPTSPVDVSGLNYVFYDVNPASCTLYVPALSLSAYKSAAKWKDFNPIMGMSIINVKGTSGYTYTGLPQGPSTSDVTGSTGLVSYSYSGTGSTTYSASSTAPTNAGTYQVVSSVAANANYTGATSAAYAFTIEKKAASVTPTASNKEYGATDPSFSGTLDGFIAADNVVAAYSRTAGETVLGSPYTISATLTPDAVLSNYDITYHTANFTIEKKAASVTPTASNKEYGATDPSFSGTLDGFIAADNVVAAYSRTAGETVLGSPYTISATLTPDAVLSNYDITYHTANFTIGKKAASVTPTASNKEYGATDPSFSGTIDGFIAADNVVAAYSRTAGETVAGSPYTISATLTPDAVLSNYDITYHTANFTIGQASSTISVTGTSGYTYTGLPQGPSTSDVTGSTGLVSYSYSGTGSTTYSASSTAPTNVGTYQVIASVVADANYTGATSAAYAFTIEKKAASVTPTASNKEYGATDPSFSGTLDGFIAADNVVAAYSRTAGETVAGSPYTISATLTPDAVLSNYDITYHTANFTIEKKAASVTPTASNKEYGATDPSFSGTLDGFIAADNVVAAYSRTAGETVLGSPYTISATLTPDAVLSNYDITYHTADFTIGQASSTISVTGTSGYTYTGFPQGPSTSDVTGSTGLVSYSYSGTGSTTYSASPTAPTNAGTYQVVSSVVADANYTGATSAAYAFTIEKKAASVTPTASNKEYGAADPSFSGTLDGFIAADNVVAAYSRTAGETVAGSPYTISATLTPDAVLSNYDITYHTANFTIEKKAASVTPTASNKEYGATDPSFSGTLDGFIAADNVVAAYSRTAGETVAGSPYTISATLTPDAVLSNYDITYHTANFTIGQASSTISVTGTSGYTYTGLPQGPSTSDVTGSTGLVSYSYSGTGSTTYSASSTAPTNVGTYQVIASVVADANYTGATSAAYAFTIEKKAASVTPTASNKEYGATDPSFSGTLDGFIAADNVVAAYSRTAGETVAGSPYTISATLTPDAVLSNYDITYHTANFTIEKKAASVTPTASNKEYGATDPSFSGTLDGFIAADNVVAAYSRTAGETVLGSPYTISATLTPDAVLSNYDITYHTADFTIGKKAASVTPTASGKEYGATDPSFSGTLDGFIAADNVVATYSRTAGETVVGSPYTISATLTPGEVLDNYNITYHTAEFTIGQASSTISVTGTSGYTYTGLPQGPSTSDVTGSTGLVSYSYSGTGSTTYSASPTAPTNAGTYQVVSSVAADANYTGGTSAAYAFTIEKKAASVTPTASNKEYGATDPSFSGTLDGFIAADNVVAAYSRTAGETVAGSPYTISATLTPDAVLSNYDITYHTANFTIEKKAASVTPTASNKEYGATDPSFSGTLDGFIAADNVVAAYSRTAGETVAGSPYTISATLTPDAVLSNYDITYHTANFTIGQASSTISVTGTSGYTYTGLPQGPSTSDVTGSTGLVSYSYSGTGSTTYSASSTAPTNVGTYQVIASVVADANYTGATSAAYAFTIEKKAASVTPTASNKEYGATDPSFSGTLDGFIAADNVVAAYSRTAGETVAGSPYTISATLTPDAVLSNYDITYHTANFTIEKKAASVTPTASNKEYGATDPSFSGTLDGFIAADNVVAAYSRTAGETVLGSPYTISATLTPDAVLSNYDITYHTADFTIGKKAASVTPTASGKEYGATDPSFSGTLDGFIAADNVVATYSRTAGETVVGSPYTISATLTPGEVLDNYNITYHTAEFTIGQASSTISVTGTSGYTYTGLPQGPSTSDVTGSTGLVSYSYSGTGSTTYSASSTAPTNAGTYQVIASVVADANYTGATSAAYAFTIEKKAASVTPTASNKEYGATDPSFSGTLDGFIATDNVVATYSRTAGETVLGSPYTISATLTPDAVLSNYDITYHTANFTIGQASSTISVTGTSGYTYTGLPQGSSTSDVTGSTGLVSYSYSGTGSTTYSASSTAPTNAGTYQVIASVVADANYTGATSAAYAFAIEKKAASVTPTASNKEYGATDPSFSGTLDGFIATDNVVATYSRTAGETVASSPYTISATLTPDAVLSNYEITYHTAEFTIGQASSTISVTVTSGYTYTGFPQGPSTSDVTGSTGSVSYSYSGTGSTTYNASSTAPTNAGTYQVVSSVAADANYTGATSAAYAFTIEKKAASVTPTASNKEYGATDPSFSGTLDGFIATDNVVATYSRTAGETVASSPYTISATLTPDAVLSNYDITYHTADFTIGQASSTISVTGTSGYTYTGLPQGPSTSDVTGSTGLVSYSYSGTGSTTYSASPTAPTNAGTYQVVSSVAADANYTGATSAAYAFTIEKAQSVIVILGKTSYTYNGFAQGPISSYVEGSTGAVSYSYSGTGITGFSSTPPTNVGDYSARATVAADANHNSATSADLSYTIYKANATIVVTPYDVLYNGSEHIATGIATGVNNEDLGSLLNLDNTKHTSIGDYTDSWTFAGNTNYNSDGGTVLNHITVATGNGTSTVQKMKVIVYQNQISNYVNFKFTPIASGKVTIIIYNMAGFKIDVLKNTDIEGGKEAIIQYNKTLPVGAYIYVLESVSGLYSDKFIIIR